MIGFLLGNAIIFFTQKNKIEARRAQAAESIEDVASDVNQWLEENTFF